MDKQALSFYVIMFTFFKMFILMTVMFSIVLIIRTFIAATVDVGEAEAELLFSNMLNSPGGITYKDPVTGRVYPGMINASEFADPGAVQKRLAATFYSEKRGIAARLTLKDPKSREILKYGNAALDSVYYNKEDYNRWIVLAKTKGAGGATEYIIRRDVVLAGNPGYAMLEASIVIPRS